MPRNATTHPHPTLGEERVLGVLKPSQLYQLEALKAALCLVFPRIEIVCPKSLDHLHSLLGRCRTTHKLVLAIGGDGTLHQVLQGLDTAEQVLALLPLGTGNDFARIIGYPAGLKAKAARLAELTTTPTDFGVMSGQRYINSAGFGLDSAALALREAHPKNRLLQNYNLAFIRVLASLQPIPARIELDGEQVEGQFYWVLAMNNAFIGGGTRIAPAARVDDGKLDALLVRADSKWEMLVNLPRAIQGKHLGMQQVIYRQVSHLRCAAERPVRYLAADGELHFHGEHVVDFTVRPRELRMLR